MYNEENRECIYCGKKWVHNKEARKKGHSGNICNSCSVTKCKKKQKLKAIEYKGGCCQHCGYNKSMNALIFHHLVPAEKEFNMGNYGRTISWEKVKKEIDKCILLCHNCHSEEHERLDCKVFFDVATLKEVKQKVEIICLQCKKTFKSFEKNQKFCSLECSSFSKRKAIRPLREQLEEMIKTMPLTQIGRLHGVSDNSIRKWAKSYNLIS